MSSNKNGGEISALKRTFVNNDGCLRAVWQLIITWSGWYALYLGSAILLSRLMLSMFSSWGVNNANIALAPGWVQYLTIYQAELLTAVPTLIASAAAWFALRCYRRRTSAPSARTTAAAFTAGVAAAMALMVIFLLADSMRITSPVPELTPDIVLLLLFSLITSVFESIAVFGYVRLMADRHINRLAGHVAAAVTFFIFGMVGFVSVGAAINSLLIGLALSLIAERYSLFACAALRTGWLWTVCALAGFPENVRGVFTMYPVSENFLTGGYAGPEGGFAVALICAAIIAVYLIIPEIKHRRRKA